MTGEPRCERCGVLLELNEGPWHDHDAEPVPGQVPAFEAPPADETAEDDEDR